MYDDILIPTDGSEASQAAVKHGITSAEAHGATVHLLYVVDIGTEMSASAVGTIAEELTDTLEGEAEDALDSAEEQADKAAVPFERTVLEGVPHEAIAEYSADHDVDFIAMGASGQSGLKEHLLGSTTDRVVRSVDVPVLLTRP